jgi:hypothetical protein
MQYKYIYFGNSVNSESQLLEFVDKHWERVISAGYSEVMDAESFEVPGYYARLAKTPVVSDSAKISKQTPKKAA